ncbi:LexA repressor [Mesobacillus zeae]|uniref:LexA repressor n=1 Tax=Mesobacillus zeae TaxID=1917180 RepID=A0A398B834_9BACI|nr:LexA repressor [Mesobacillus zeae]RID85644.1 LexA repressor [Mesobacillus zeae]
MNTTKRNILMFITNYIEEHGYSPSFREVGEAVGLLSTSSIHHHLTALKKSGYITFIERSPRTIRILKV